MNDRSDATSPASGGEEWTRRDLLRRGGIAIVGIALAGAAHRNARAQAAKTSKASVQYVDRYGVDGKDCDDCIQFVPGAGRDAPGTCKIVDGPISPHGHCIAFVPKKAG